LTQFVFPRRTEQSDHSDADVLCRGQDKEIVFSLSARMHPVVLLT
jgi:hypothetical protein